MDVSAGTEEEASSKTKEESSETEGGESSETEEFSDIVDDYYKLVQDHQSDRLPCTIFSFRPKVTLTLDIPNFSSRTINNHENIFYTSLFDFGDQLWRVLLYPGDPICFLLQKQPSSTECCVECALSFRRGNEKVSFKRFTYTYGADDDTFGCFLPSNRELMRDNPDVVRFNVLTIYVVLMRGEPKGPLEPVPLYYMGYGTMRHKKPFGFFDGLPRIIIQARDRQDQVDYY